MPFFRTVLLTVLKLFSSVSELNSTRFLGENIRTYRQKSLITLAIVLLCTKTTDVLFFSVGIKQPENRFVSLSLLFALSMPLSSRGHPPLSLRCPPHAAVQPFRTRWWCWILRRCSTPLGSTGRLEKKLLFACGQFLLKVSRRSSSKPPTELWVPP